MSATKTDSVEIVEEVKEKEIIKSPKKGEKVEEKVEKDKKEDNAKNGDSCDSENGKSEESEVDGKVSEEELVCPVKRKSTSGGDVANEKQPEGVSPEKKAKLDEAAVDGEANGDAKLAA